MPRTRDEKLLVAIGRRFQKIRRANGLTQEELAELLDVQPITLSRWERGERAMSLSLLAQASDALDVRLGDLLDVRRKMPAAPPDIGEKELVRLYRKMSGDVRNLALRLLREVAK